MINNKIPEDMIKSDKIPEKGDKISEKKKEKHKNYFYKVQIIILSKRFDIWCFK